MLNFKAATDIDNISIIDVLGRTVLSTNPVSASTTIDISALPEGFYSVMLINGHHKETQKLVINRR